MEHLPTQRPAFLVVAVALFCALWLLLAPGADAQTITNVASARWTEAGKAFSTESNRVAFDVTEPAPSIETFVAATTGVSSLPFTPSECGGSSILVSESVLREPQVASVQSTSTLHIGNTFFFRIVAAAANRDARATDVLEARILTTSGDEEVIRVFETGTDTGVFVGAVSTTAVPPDPRRGDCRLSVAAGDTVSIRSEIAGRATSVATAQMAVLADPFGLVFDSETGTPISGATVTLVNVDTGLPATVYAEDGVTLWPSKIVSGQTVTDGAGNVYNLPEGEFRFPLVANGRYRLVVDPPAPYTAPSQMRPIDLTDVKRRDGQPVTIEPASFGNLFTISSASPVRIDIPLDAPPAAVTLAKTASRRTAQPGDLVVYTVTATNPDQTRAKRKVVLLDTAPPSLRLRPDSVRIDGIADPSVVTVSDDGTQLTVRVGSIAAGATRTITYAMTVRPDAAPGEALNKVMATDVRGLVSYASAPLRIEEDGITARMTLIGRVTAGGCAVGAARQGIPGVRVMLEDGSFAVTDADGRYHFDGLLPGTHVAQVAPETLPEGGRFVNCGRSTRNAGSPISRFVGGQGGSLAVADFHAVLPAGTAVASPAAAASTPEPLSDRVAAGGETDWIALGDGPTEFVFPTVDHNPRAPAVRVVIRHRAGQKVELSVDGVPAEKVSFEGIKLSADRTWGVSIWRGIPIDGEVARLAATVRNADGSVAAQLSRDVHFTQMPAQIRLVPEMSRLVADGRTRPVIALRVLDRNGRPVHAGIAGDFTLSAPYESAEALDAMQARALSGLGRTAPRWTVKGDDGIALVELAPTMVSGAMQLDFAFTDGQQKRRQTVDAWMVPGDLKWTLVGLAEGSVGARTIADAMQRTGRFDSDLGRNGRVAFYAKGRVLGRHLLTMAYDSARQRDDQRLLGALDPKAYYTVYADGSDRRFDAASRNKLYVRIESRAFHALFGDFETGFSQTQLARYQRTATGVRAELASNGFHAQGFATRVATAFRRDEIQGGGISGPYRLSSRSIVASSEKVAIEVRDRFRSEVLVSRTTLTRFVDYDIDLLAGTITFRQPLLSRDAALNPQIAVVEYEVDPGLAAGGELNAGARADWTSRNGAVRIGATAITDKGQAARTDIVALDLRARPSEKTEIRAEAALSRRVDQSDSAWLVEAEHHAGNLDLLAYARSADADFGVGQISGAETGRRKLGVDARYRMGETLSLVGSAWLDDSLSDASRRQAVRLTGEHRSGRNDLRLGIATMRDRLADGALETSTVLEAGVSRRMLDNRLQVDASTSVALGATGSVDLPERHQLGLRYSLTPQVKLLGTYEIAKGEAVNARTARAGFEVQPWNGARAVTAMGQQDIREQGRRTFATFGLTQSLNVTSRLMIDASVDASKVIGGLSRADVINPAHPVSSGGRLGSGTLAEDFTALTLGAAWRSGRWSVTARGELRDGESARRKGVSFGAIRQIGEGTMIGSGVVWTHADGSDGSLSDVFSGTLAAAIRPAESRIAVLAKLEFRADKAVAGVNGGDAAGATAIAVAGSAASRRLIASVSSNWSPRGRLDDTFVERTEIGVFAALRHNFDRYDGYNLAGTTLMGGVDLRIGIGERIDIGGSATVRTNVTDRVTRFAAGPQIGFTPARDVLMTVGYNVTGFRDRDFSAARNTDRGFFASLKAKFDTGSFGFLGLGR